MKMHKKITYTMISVFTLFILWGCFNQLEHFNINVHAEERVVGNLDINETNFPDAEFRRYLKENHANGKEFLTQDEVNNVTEIIIDRNYTVRSINGIAFFENLEKLGCLGAKITEIDVSRNQNLKELECGYSSALTSVKVNEKIEVIKCTVSSITELDVSHCENLVQLFCDNNKLKSLNLSNNKNLELLSCGTQPLASLDITNNFKLNELYIDQTNISTIDISKNPELILFSFSNTAISEVNVEHLTNLEKLIGDDSNLTAINIMNNKVLEVLSIKNTLIESLSFPEQNKIDYLSMNSIPIETLDTTNLTNLISLACENTKLKSLDLSNSPLLNELYCGNTEISSLDTSNNILLKHLYCENTNISKLDIHKNTDLKLIKVDNAKLMSLDISNNTELTGFSGEDQHPETILLYGKNSVDLKDYDSEIDGSKIQNLQGAVLEGTILKNITPGTDVTYIYDLGEEMDSPLDVTLHFYGENVWTSQLNMESWTYKDIAQQPHATSAFGNVQYLYSNTIDGQYTDILPVNASTWYVKAIVEESEDFKGLESAPFTFQIMPRNALSEDIVISEIKSQEDIDTFLVKDKEEVLARGVDYDVTSSTNNNTTTVTITFKGNYTGIITKTFTSKTQTVETGIASNNLLWTNVLLLSGITLYVCIKKKKKA